MNRKIKNILMIFLFFLMFISRTQQLNASSTGWTKTNSGWVYINNHLTSVKGWKKISGTWYLFSKNGVLVEKRGWEKHGSNWMFGYGSHGYATNYEVRNWNKDLATYKKYYFNSNGLWQQSYYCNSDGHNIKGALISVNIKTQTQCLFYNGKFKFSSRFVSGDSTKKRWTTPGWHKILVKKQNTLLDGSTVGVGKDYKYKIPVKYWLPFTKDGQGLHDLTSKYRNDWSDTAYKRGNGSHGCLNMKYNDIKKLWSWVKVGTPVYIHN